MSATTSQPPVLSNLAGVSPQGESTFEHVATATLGKLQAALADLLAAAPGDTHRPTDVGQVFGIDYRLAWQVHRIATVKPTLAAGTNVPARVSIKKLLKAAQTKQVPAEVVQRVARAFDDFEQMADTHAGDRASLEAMLSAFIPEEREKYEQASRQMMFRGMSHYKGVSADASMSAVIFHPSENEMKIDRVALHCDFGLRRTRPDARIVIGIGNLGGLPYDTLTLDGQPAKGPLGTLLREFSTSPLPDFDTHHVNGMAYYFAAGRDVGMKSALDLALADRKHADMDRYWLPGKGRTTGLALAVDTPIKRLTMDVFMHKDLFTSAVPQLYVYDTACRGWVHTFDDPAREHDRLHAIETIRELPAGLNGAAISHVPRYVEMLEHIHKSVGWNPSHFRAFRLDVHYPMYGAQYSIGLQLPERPTAE